MIDKNSKICIIGAGSTGIAACKNFFQAGLDFMCFEASSEIGGNWVFKNSNGMSSAYKSLHINTSREKMQYYDFPMPEHYPDFPHHSDIAHYFNAYVDHFNFRDKIEFNSLVTNARLLKNGQWEIHTNNLNSPLIFDALVVANGHHWDPRMPEPRFKGSFAGEEIHSHYYLSPKDPLNCIDKNIVVVGGGNSAMDIACELSQRNHARKVFISMRTPVWVAPKYFGSAPLDSFQRHPSEKKKWYQHILEPMNVLLSNYILTKKVIQHVGNPKDIGLLQPEYKFTQAHPTISSEIQIRLGSGDLIAKPNIKRLRDHHVEFEDGSIEDIDIVIYATGYKISFPFLDKDIIDVENNDIALYKRIFLPGVDNLFFLGLVQPLGALMPIADEQSKLLTQLFLGQYKLPEQKEMIDDALKIHNQYKSHYLSSPRHTIQINVLKYTDNLRSELKRGKKRALS